MNFMTSGNVRMFGFSPEALIHILELENKHLDP